MTKNIAYYVNKLKIIFLFTVSIFILGCTPHSSNPITNFSEAILEDKLNGAWQIRNPDKLGYIHIEKWNDKHYWYWT